MKWSIPIVAAAAIALLMTSALSMASDAAAKDIKKQLTLRGCVTEGEKKGTFLFSDVTELPPTGEYAMPEWAHGRRVVYWLRNLKNLTGQAGHIAEITGTLESFKNSEIELKKGRQPNGDIYVEFEGPGKDIRAANSAVGGAIGTAGPTTPEKDDVKTMLAVINVKGVKVLPSSCR